MARVHVRPEVLRWAQTRARWDDAHARGRFPAFDQWMTGERQPTLRQLEEFAKATHAPIGYLFLPSPPDEPLPIPDFRTIADRPLARPSPDLLDTIYLCQRRQEWYREYAAARRLPLFPVLGTARLSDEPADVGDQMRLQLQLPIDARRECATWEDALRKFIAAADQAGVMVMNSGIVGNNTHRTLDPDEFRGFALADELATVVFVNGADTKSAQMFTLAHELAHLWLGQSALSNADASGPNGIDVERWCNAVAAEFLMPLNAVVRALVPREEPGEAMRRFARQFKVSTLVALRRLYDADFLGESDYWALYHAEVRRLRDLAESGGSGGNFYLSQAARVSKRFARALIESTLEGQTLYRDAMRMLGVAKVATFNELGRSLGYPL